MADSIAARLEALKLKANTSAALSSAFSVALDTNCPQAHEWKARMSPRDMAALKVVAGGPVKVEFLEDASKSENKSTAKISDMSCTHHSGTCLSGPLATPSFCIFTAWPSVVVPSKTIRLSPIASQSWNFNTGRQCRVLPIDPSIIPEAKTVTVQFLCPSAAFHKDALQHFLLQLEVVQLNTMYSSTSPICPFIICNATPASGIVDGLNLCRITSLTRLECWASNVDQPLSPKSADFGGLADQSSVLLNSIEQTFKSNVSHSCIGAILYGPPGTGKSTLAHAIAAKLDAQLVKLDLSLSTINRVTSEDGDSVIFNVFDTACDKPTVVVVDGLDSFCLPGDDNVKSAVARFCSKLDFIANSYPKQTFVIATVKNIDAIHPSLRRPGRLELEVEFSVPRRDDRLAILKTLWQQCIHFSANVTPGKLASIADRAHGFVGADLAMIWKEAVSIALLQNEAEILSISDTDLESGFLRVKPSSIRDVQIEVPNVRWDDIGGQELTKQKLRECVEWPLRMPEKFALFGIKPPKGVLLYGPPGCSKTLLAKALATESKLNFLAVKGPELLSKWVGDSERAVRDVFRKAKNAAPSVIFFDEFDSIGGRRDGDGGSAASATDRVLSQLLSELDGIDPLLNVIVVAATNRPDVLDEALLRPGRFDRHVYVALPDFDARVAIFRIQSRTMPFNCDVDIEMLAAATDGFSGAEIAAICSEAAMTALGQSENAANIEHSHFKDALAVIKPHTPVDLLNIYKHFSLR